MKVYIATSKEFVDGFAIAKSRAQSNAANVKVRWVECSLCEGTGKSGNADCSACNGYGGWWEDDGGKK